MLGIVKTDIMQIRGIRNRFKAKLLDYSYKYETNLYGFQLHFHNP